MQDERTGPKLCECGCERPAPIAPGTNRSKGWIAGQPLRFIKWHNTRRRNIPSDYAIEDRGYATPCWVWQLSVTPEGYAQSKVGRRRVLVHRVNYERQHGPIACGLVLDHLCRVRACVNPDHLEAVRHEENCRRGDGAKLTATDVAAIRQLCTNGVLQGFIAERFGITQQTVSQIKRRTIWKDIL